MTNRLGCFCFGFSGFRPRRPYRQPSFYIPKVNVPRVAFVDQYGRSNTLIDKDPNTITVGFQRNPSAGGTNTASVGREDFVFQDPRGNNSLSFNH